MNAETADAILSSRLFQVIQHIIVLLTAFPIHESAHALTADLLGDHTARDEGRISLNPFRHFSLMGTLLMIFVGVGWAKPVPIDARNFKNPKNGMALTALAGPLSNLLLAFISMIIYRCLDCYYGVKGIDSLYQLIITEIVGASVYINIGLAVFNMLPFPPMDGSRIFNLVMTENAYFNIMKYERYILAVTLIAVYSGLLDKPLAWLQYNTMSIMVTLTNWVDVLMNLLMGTQAA